MDATRIALITLFSMLACALVSMAGLASRGRQLLQRHGLREWLAGLGMQCLAWPIFALQWPSPRWAQAVACALLVAGYAAMGRAFLRSLRDRPPGWIAYAPAVLLLLALLLPGWSSAPRIAAFWLFALATGAMFVPPLLRHVRGQRSWPQRAVVAILIGGTAIAAYRFSEQCVWLYNVSAPTRMLSTAQAAALAYFLLAPVFATFAFLMLHQERQRLWLEGLAAQDPLTGINNRRAFFERATALAGAGKDGKRLVALLMIDIDNFKAINDLHGHAAGDALLSVFARALQGALHEREVAGRLGGDEFCALLLDLAPGVAADRADRLRQYFAAHPLRMGSKVIAASVSIGVACARWDRDLDLEALLSSADRRLYLAKRAGRNRVISTDLQLADAEAAHAAATEEAV